MSEPIYLQHSDLPKVERNYHDIALDLCEVCEKLIPGTIIGAQYHNRAWSVRARTEKGHIVYCKNGELINIRNTNVEMHDSYPIAKSVPDEKNCVQRRVLSTKR